MAFLALVGCFRMEGVEPEWHHERTVDPGLVSVPEGFSVRAVTVGLDRPVGMTLDGQGRPCVTEAGSADGSRRPRLICIAPDGELDRIAVGGRRPWSGVSWDGEGFWLAEGGERGRVMRVGSDGILGERSLPGPLEAANVQVAGGYVYVGLGKGGCAQEPVCDERIGDPLVPWAARANGCQGAVFRFPIDGGAMELVAWDLGQVADLAVDPQGTLWLTEARGQTAWLRAVEPIPAPGACVDEGIRLGGRGSAGGMALAPEGAFGGPGVAYVTASRGPAAVLRVDLGEGVVEPFVGRPPRRGSGVGMPVDVVFSDDGASLWLLDGGVAVEGSDGIAPGTGVLWRIDAPPLALTVELREERP